MVETLDRLARAQARRERRAATRNAEGQTSFGTPLAQAPELTPPQQVIVSGPEAVLQRLKDTVQAREAKLTGNEPREDWDLLSSDRVIVALMEWSLRPGINAKTHLNGILEEANVWGTPGYFTEPIRDGNRVTTRLEDLKRGTLTEVDYKRYSVQSMGRSSSATVTMNHHVTRRMAAQLAQ